MGRLSEPTAKDRFRFDGESKMPRSDSTNNEGDRIFPSFCDSARKRSSCQRNDSIHDITTESQSNNRLLQQAVR